MHTAMMYAELQDRGIRPGRDLTVISCNNEQMHLMNLRPRPATINLQTGMIGRVAAEWLLRRMRKNDGLAPVVSLVSPIMVPPA
jgi:DNA-binding LacI/PurR family transcriptional regulator